MTRLKLRAPVLLGAAHFLVAATLVLLPYHAFLSVWVGSSLRAYRAAQLWKEAIILVVLLGLFAVVPWRSLVWFLRRQKYLFVAISLYIVLTLVSGLISYRNGLVNAEAGIFALIINLRFLLFFTATYLLFSVSPRRLHWLKIILLPVIPVLLFGLAQEFLLPPRFLELFGYSKWTILPFQYVNAQENLLRIQSFLRGANPLGAYLALIMPVTLYRFFTSTDTRKKFCYALLCLLSALVLFYTYSRSAWLGVIVSLIVLCALYTKRGFNTHRTQLLYAGASFVFLLLVGAVSLPSWHLVSNAVFHSNSASISTQTSDGLRLFGIRESMARIQSHPLGYGLGTAGPASVRNTKAQAFIPENYFLQIALEVGLPGLALFLIINAIVAYRLWQQRSSGLALVLLASLAGITVVNVLSHAWADDTLSLLWWGLAGTVLSGAAVSRPQRNASEGLLILASTFPRWTNDTVPSFVLAFAQHIAPFFGRITVVAPHYKGAKCRDVFDPDIVVRRFRYAYPYEYENVAYGQFKKSTFYPLKMLLYIASELWTTLLVSLRTRSKIINAHWLIPQGFVAVLVAPLIGARTVISIHGSDVFTLNGKYMRQVKRFTLQRADIVVTNSSATQAKCTELWPGREYPIIPMGVDVEEFGMPRKRHEGYRVLFVGRLVPNKGVRYLCEAVALLRKRYHDIHLEVIGDGPERPALEQYVTDSDLQDVITLAGWEQPNALPERYAGADVFVGPSVEDEQGAREAFGLVFAEASAARLPVVATDVGGIKDIVQDKVNGIIVPQRDAQSIADAIAYLHDHARAAKAMGERGQKMARERFSWTSVAARYRELL